MALSVVIKEVQSRIEQALKNQLKKSTIADPLLKDAMTYSLLLGGKRVRPLLVYATGELFGANKADLDAPAMALEAIHTYSLIHDDLPAMDDDDLRRGQLTCHKKYDEATAILAGDALQSFAFSILTEHEYQAVPADNQIAIIKTIANAATNMCAGQSIDLQNTNSNDGDNKSNSIAKLAQLENMHNLKTGALIKASVITGALAAGATNQQLDSLTRYANAIGLAFQVWDDVLDIVSDTETLGKPQGSDLESNKTTYPALLGLEQTKLKAQQLVKNAQTALSELPGNTETLSQLAQYIIERDH